MQKQPTTQRQSRGIQRIAAILDAAETIFAQMGYDEATTNHIAARAGISPGSLYQFFANKEDIAQGIAIRYTENLQEMFASIFSIEKAKLPFSPWLDQILDALIQFHFDHPAFHIILSIPAQSLHLKNLTNALPKNLQNHFELGFKMRSPNISAEQRTLMATMSVEIFKAILPSLLQAEGAKRKQLVLELKTALQRYLQPVLGE